MRCPIKSGMTILFIPDGMIVMFVIAGILCLSLPAYYVCHCRLIMFAIAGILCLLLPAYYVCHCRLIMFVIAGLTGNLFNHFVNVNLQVATLDEIVEGMLTKSIIKCPEIADIADILS